MKWYDVTVTFNDGEVHYDGIKGGNESVALENAYYNWPDAAHIEITKEMETACCEYEELEVESVHSGFNAPSLVYFRCRACDEVVSDTTNDYDHLIVGI